MVTLLPVAELHHHAGAVAPGDDDAVDVYADRAERRGRIDPARARAAGRDRARAGDLDVAGLGDAIDAE